MTVVVSSASLSFEVAPAYTRIPSLVRFPMILRNLRYQAMPLPILDLGFYSEQFAIFEKEQPLEITETNQFLTAGNRLRTNIGIMLDYDHCIPSFS
jgi:hypothetical protein